MADIKVTALTALAAPTSDDLLYIVNDPTGVAASRKISVNDFLGVPTDGAVFFAASGIPASDSANLFWNNTDKTLVLGDDSSLNPTQQGTLYVATVGSNEVIASFFDNSENIKTLIDKNGRMSVGAAAASAYDPLFPFATIYANETVTDDIITRSFSSFFEANYAAEFFSSVFGTDTLTFYSGTVDLTDTAFFGHSAFVGQFSSNSSDLAEIVGINSEVFVTTTAGCTVARLNFFQSELLVDSLDTVTNLVGSLYGSALGMGFWSVTGTVTNSYMIYIAADSSVGTVDNYGIYNESVALNYFEGFTGFGTDTPTEQVTVSGNLLMVDGRAVEDQGVDVVSANAMTLGTDGNTFEITGATNIKSITTAGWQNGALITLLFESNPLVSHNVSGGGGTAVILLAGSVDFSATAGDTLTLRLSEIGGTQAWREVARTAI